MAVAVMDVNQMRYQDEVADLDLVDRPDARLGPDEGVAADAEPAARPVDAKLPGDMAILADAQVLARPVVDHLRVRKEFHGRTESCRSPVAYSELSGRIMCLEMLHSGAHPD